MKKLISICVALVLIFSVATTSFAAVNVNLNDGDSVEFNKLLIVENDVIYVPLRVAFNTNAGAKAGAITYGDNPNYAIKVADNIEDSSVAISMRRKDENGNVLKEGRFVRINWGEGSARLEFVKYESTEYGNQIIEEELDNYELFKDMEENIKLVPVNETGDRLFLSLADWQSIIDFMTDGNNYEVNIK